MLDKFRLKKNEKGFTLIELLIVVAIIGILAAIAIPQFAAYRQRAFNSSALSDVRNISSAQEALFADTQAYGSAVGGATLAPAAAVTASALVTGPQQGATSSDNGSFLQNALGAVPFSLSNGVTVATTSEVTGAPVVASSYVLVGKHLQGDSVYGRESDSTSSYRGIATDASTAGGPGEQLALTDIPASDGSDIDLTGAVGAYTWNEM